MHSLKINLQSSDVGIKPGMKPAKTEVFATVTILSWKRLAIVHNQKKAKFLLKVKSLRLATAISLTRVKNW